MRKTISSILIGVMLFSVTLEVQATEPAQEAETGEEEYASDDSEGEVTGSDNEFSNDSAEEDKSDENDSTGIPKEMAKEAEPDEDQESEEDEELEPEEATEPGEIYELTIKYDDRYAFSEYDEVDLTEYSVESVNPGTVTSYQEAGEKTTNNGDTNVVSVNNDADGLIATGIGTEDILFQKDDGSEITLSVTVEPATLSLLFIAGQSNAEGTCSDNTGSHPEDSVVCEEGQVYSTYAPSSAIRGKNNTGLDIGECTVNNADSFVAESLTGNTSIAGSTLTYPLNSLTESGKGKTGMDSGLAYEWNQLTGDKVWVVNAAVSATSITTWVPGGTYYERAKAVFKDAVDTVKKEEEAGHYELNNTLLFWLQGEHDYSMDASTYMKHFNNMVTGFENEELGIEYYGMVMVRASSGSCVNSDDIVMTGPRIAQYLLGNDDSYRNIYVASNVNEQWVTDSGVKSYFQGVYGSSLNYPLRSNATIGSIPSTVAKVHGDIHYSQVGHNENGLTAAKTMYEVLYGGSASSPTVYWYEEDGTKLSNGTTVSLTKNETYNFVPVVTPLSKSKEVSVTLEGSGYNYDQGTGILTVTNGGTGKLTATVNGVSVSLSLTTSASKLSTPSLKSATADADGTTINWGSVSGAKGYAVYRKVSGKGWSRIDSTSNTSYTDTTNLTSGNTYYYTVRAYQGTWERAWDNRNRYSDAYWSDYDATGLKSVYLSTPSLSSATTDSSSTKISWGKVTGADGYAVYRKLSGDSWSMLTTTTSTSYTDSSSLSSGKTYYYTVRAYTGSATTAKNNRYNAAYWGGYNTTGLKAVYLSTPSLSSATAAAGGTEISWKSVSGASGYAVYRKLSGGSWSMIDTTTSTSYTDKSSLTGGNTYYYTVRAYTGDVTTAKNNKYNAAYWSGYNTTGLKSVYLAAPTLKSAATEATGRKVTWSSVSGASGYAIYRKLSGGSWSMLTTTTSTSYTDTASLTSGKTYYYTVRAYTGSATTAKNNRYNAAYWGVYNTTGLKAVYLSTPSLSSATAAAGGTEISWKSVSGASGYAVYRKLSGGGWSMIDTTTSTSYTDKTGLTGGKIYYYTVRAYTGDVTTAKNNKYNAAYWSGYNTTGLKSVYLAVPTLSSAKTVSNGRTVSWGEVSGASGYGVYRKLSGGSWSLIATTTSTSYTDKASLTSGKTYYYTVRAYKGTASTAKNHRYNASYWGGYNTTGLKAVYLSTPSLGSATAAAGGTEISWKSVSGASGYAVYRKLSGGGWSMIDTTTSTSYTDKSSLTGGKTYYYTVRAYTGNVTTAKNNRYNAAYWSGYNTTGLKSVYLAIPGLKDVKATASGMTVSWNSVSKAGGYAVFRKEDGGSWSLIGTTTKTNYTDKSSLSTVETYYYTVRAYKGSSSTAKKHRYNAAYWSGYDSSGLSIIK